MSGVEVAALGAAADAVRRVVPGLVADRFASRLFAQDPTLWGADAEEEAGKRLGWTALHQRSRELLPQLTGLVEDCRARGLDHVVLCGMGGSSLAPEVICASNGAELTVLDSSDPDQVRRTVADRIERTVVVVSSKSGSTVETDAQRRAYVAAFESAGLTPTDHVVVVTDPGSPLEEESRAAGYQVLNADPAVGGRYSALTAFGLVPSALAGVDVSALLDEADAVADLLAADDEANPGLRLGAAMAGASPVRDKLVLVDDGSGIVGFADWAEQLVAESTGKGGTGLLPVVASTADPEVALPPSDVTVARLVADGETGSSDDADGVGSHEADAAIRVAGALGAQLLLWEVATVVAGRLLGINPFDQPDVESAKKAARSMLEGAPDLAAAHATDGDVEIRALGGDWVGDAASLEEAVARLLDQLDAQHGYVAVMAYLDRTAHPELADVRRTLAIRTRRPVTFGWGPRFLHSTGQLHKGGPPTGVYLQVTAEPTDDLPVPDRDFTFGRLIAAQAAGDADVLADHGRPVLRLHLANRGPAVDRVRDALT